MAVIDTIKIRHNTAAGAAASNPVLALAELGIETDTGRMKAGDGATAWNSLPYLVPAFASANTVSTAVLRDASGNFAAGTITAALAGNAATVTTNANLTGVITSIGNATSIASQTGTGTKFVVDTSPTISALNTTGNTTGVLAQISDTFADYLAGCTFSATGSDQVAHVTWTNPKFVLAGVRRYPTSTTSTAATTPGTTTYAYLWYTTADAYAWTYIPGAGETLAGATILQRFAVDGSGNINSPYSGRNTLLAPPIIGGGTFIDPADARRGLKLNDGSANFDLGSNGAIYIGPGNTASLPAGTPPRQFGFKSTGAVFTLGLTVAGALGAGVTSPTAVLHLKAGTATASTAPVKFTAGTLLTALELGTMEFVDNGTTGHLYITLNQAGVLTRVQIV